MGGKLGDVPRFWGDLTQCGLGQGLPPYQVASGSIEPFGYNRHGPKSGGAVPPFWGEGVGPQLTECRLEDGK